MIITYDDVVRFTSGGCVALAIMIHGETGWPVHSFYDTRYDEYILHSFVKTPRGTYLDITGERLEREMHDRWNSSGSYVIRSVPSGEFDEIWGGHPYGEIEQWNRARQILPSLLSTYEKSPRHNSEPSLEDLYVR